MWSNNYSEKITPFLQPEKSWLLGVTGSNTVEHKPNLLELWISGKYARLMESLPEDKVFDHSVENLHRFLNKKYNVTKPIAMMRTQWFTNPHFRGTYSYTSVEAIKNNINADDLEEPITTQNLVIKNVSIFYDPKLIVKHNYWKIWIFFLENFVCRRSYLQGQGRNCGWSYWFWVESSWQTIESL